MRIGYFIIYLLSGMLTLNVVAQKNRIDSMRRAIDLAANDSLKVEALYEYMKANAQDNTSDFEPYIKEMVRLSKKIHFKWGLSTAYILGLVIIKDIANTNQPFYMPILPRRMQGMILQEILRLNEGHLHTTEAICM